MFFHTSDKMVNLEKVSNINILGDKMRIVFNMCYPIEMETYCKANKRKVKKMISDYVYWDATNKDSFDYMTENLYKNAYFSTNFLQGSDYNNNLSYINLNHVSSIKFCEDKARVIFNLSHSVSFIDNNGSQKITSEFVFVNHKDVNVFRKYKERLQLLLK